MNCARHGFSQPQRGRDVRKDLGYGQLPVCTQPQRDCNLTFHLVSNTNNGVPRSANSGTPLHFRASAPDKIGQTQSKTTALRIPAWSPTVVLTERYFG